MQDVLNWMREDVRLEVLQYANSTDTDSGENSQKFFRVLKLGEEEMVGGDRKKEYLGYSVAWVQKKQLLHPVLSILVRLEMKGQEEFHRLKRVIRRHIERPSASVQKVYSYKGGVFGSGCVLSLSCELYNFSLEEIMKGVFEKKIERISSKLGNYLISFLFQAYRSILDFVIETREEGLSFSFCVSVKNVLFDRFYSIILGNPFYGNTRAGYSFVVENSKGRYIKGDIRRQIKSVIDVLHEIGQASFVSQTSEVKELIHSKEETIDVEKELQRVEKILSSILMEFPDQQIVIQLKKAQKSIGEFSKLSKFNHEQKQRNIVYLKYLSQIGEYQAS